jgi:hypothetical protein
VSRQIGTIDNEDLSIGLSKNAVDHLTDHRFVKKAFNKFKLSATHSKKLSIYSELPKSVSSYKDAERL